jgi:adenylate cyclase
VETIIAKGEAQASRKGTMTISFVDMRDFTGWSERLPADTLIDLLNRFLAAMTRPIGAAGGITDKYIGDAVMACWGAPFTADGSQAADACAAALGQIEALEPLRAELAGLAGVETLNAVVGVATGDVLSGDIGPPSARNFTVIGNAVNLAARLQEAAKVYGVSVIVSEETRERAGEGFVTRELDRIVVRGSHRPVTIFALLGREGAVEDRVLDGARRYEAALDAMRHQAWDAAEAGLAETLRLLPGDKAARLMLERLHSYALHPPPDGWDGVWRGPAITVSADEPVGG